MTLFREKRCAAFSWDDKGRFFGVYGERQGEKVIIHANWKYEVTGSQDTNSEIILQGLAEMGVHNDALLLLGGEQRHASFMELMMPDMTPENMTQALEFEVPKYSPLPAESVRWGFRRLELSEDGQRRVRLITVKREAWNSWVDTAIGLGRGVDMIMPAVGVPDPVLKDTQVALPGKKNIPYLMSFSPTGLRQLTRPQSEHEEMAAFGTGDHPFEHPSLDPGDLVKVDHDDIASFMPALLLVMYGLSPGFYTDRKYWIEMPRQLKPKRNLGLKLWFAAAVIALVGVLLYTLSLQHTKQKAELALLNAKKTELVDALTAYGNAEDAMTWLDTLEHDLQETLLSRRSVGDSLTELQTLLDQDVWVSRYAWNDGSITLNLTADAEKPDVVPTLRTSEIFDKVTQVRIDRMPRSEKVVLQLSLYQKTLKEFADSSANTESEAPPVTHTIPTVPEEISTAATMTTPVISPSETPQASTSTIPAAVTSALPDPSQAPVPSNSGPESKTGPDSQPTPTAQPESKAAPPSPAVQEPGNPGKATGPVKPVSAPDEPEIERVKTLPVNPPAETAEGEEP